MPSGSRLVHVDYGKIGPERMATVSSGVTMHRGELWERYALWLHFRATVPCRRCNDGLRTALEPATMNQNAAAGIRDTPPTRRPHAADIASTNHIPKSHTEAPCRP